MNQVRRKDESLIGVKLCLESGLMGSTSELAVPPVLS